MNKQKLNILGINVSTLDQKSILQKVDGFLNDTKPNFLVTANPEIILRAMEDEEYFVLINKANLVVPDGIGLKFAAWALFKNIHRFTGVDLTEYLLAQAEAENIKLGILIWSKGLTSKNDLVAILKNKYPRLNFICQEIERDVAIPVNEEFNNFQPQLIFVALGFPWQEKFIYHQLLNKNYVRLALGVGGTFDFICGKIVRAPKMMRILGLEWIWRVIKQPQNRKARLKRVYNAFFVFVIKYLNWRFIKPWQYRPNVACLLYKKENGIYKILIVKRSDWQEAHWQIPQGGRDGTDVEAAGKRELREELNIKDIKTIVSYNNLYKYKFGERGEETSYVDHAKKHTGYRGQIQSLYIAEFLGQDSDIKINYWDHNGWKWVDADNLLNEVHPVRREGYKIYLEKFNKTILSF